MQGFFRSQFFAQELAQELFAQELAQEHFALELAQEHFAQELAQELFWSLRRGLRRSFRWRLRRTQKNRFTVFKR